MSNSQLFKIYETPEFERASMVVGWNEDAGKLGTKVIDYLNRKLGGRLLAEIEPGSFFPLGGVTVEDNVARFPESKFYWCPENHLVSFISNQPRFEWYKFMESVLDVSEQCHVKELYTIGGMVYLGAHTTPRQLIAFANSPEMREVLSRYDLAQDIDYETPPGQRPTLNSFLIWTAKRRNISAASLWVPIPFYLVAAEDPQAWKKIVEFLDKRLDLGIDLRDLDIDVSIQNEKIAQLRSHSPEIDNYIQKLESNMALTQDENEALVKELEDFLRKSE